MPYMNCPKCRMSVYSAAIYSTHDTCPRCSSKLANSPRPLIATREALERVRQPARVGPR